MRIVRGSGIGYTNERGEQNERNENQPLENNSKEIIPTIWNQTDPTLLQSPQASPCKIEYGEKNSPANTGSGPAGFASLPPPKKFMLLVVAFVVA
jgi:hypothetical protein